MPRAVKFDHYGDVEVLYLADVPLPAPASGEVVVRVRSAGVNPGEIGIRTGAMDHTSPAHFPEGQGTELSGVIHSIGAGVDELAVGDAVICMSETRGAQAEYAVIAIGNVLIKPLSLDWDTAAVVPIAGATALASREAVAPEAGETIVVAGGSGGVGVVAVQLFVQSGAHVIATASEPNHDFLRGLGATPITYGDGLEERIRNAAPEIVDGFADCHGEGNVGIAIALGVPPQRINTIIDFQGAQGVGATSRGMYQLDDISAALRPLLCDVADGTIAIPIKARYALSDVRDAYRRLTQSGGVGKVVLTVSTDD